MREIRSIRTVIISISAEKITPTLLELFETVCSHGSSSGSENSSMCYAENERESPNSVRIRASKSNISTTGTKSKHDGYVNDTGDDDNNRRASIAGQPLQTSCTTESQCKYLLQLR